MPCRHRFFNDLIPKYSLKYLFIGTFNPEWNNPNGNNANWFYGRKTNSFWNIMPRTFGYENLNYIRNREDPNIWKQFCIHNNIGITDLVSTISNVEFDNDLGSIIKYKDDYLETKNLIFTNIIDLIKNNSKTLQGVYLTRYIHGLNPNSQFLHKWSEIENLCNELNIHNNGLVTPSNGYMMPVNQKIHLWQECINIIN